MPVMAEGTANNIAKTKAGSASLSKRAIITKKKDTMPKIKDNKDGAKLGCGSAIYGG